MGIIGSLTGSDAADAAKKASGQVMAGQRQARNYLQDYYAPMQGQKTEANQMLAGFYGLDGGDPNAMYQSVMQSPQYGQMINAGEQGVLRNASATGGMRGGNVQRSLANNSQNVLNSMVNQRVQGLQGFANRNTGENDIANIMMQMGQTQGQGTTAAAQSRQQGIGNLMKMATSGFSGGMSMYGQGGGFSPDGFSMNKLYSGVT